MDEQDYYHEGAVQFLRSSGALRVRSTTGAFLATPQQARPSLMV